MKTLKICNWLMLLFSLMTFSGCVPALLVGDLAAGAAAGAALSGDVPSFQGTDSLALETARPDILDIIAETGKSLGYRVSGLNKEGGSIQLTTKPTIVDKALFSGFQTNPIVLSFQISEDGKKINITFMGTGKKVGTPEGAKEVLEEFKSKLSENLKRK